MPLKTPEEKKNAIKWVVQQLKIYVIAVSTAFATVWGVAEIYLESYVRNTAIEIIEEKNGNKSFREILGEQIGIPTDIVPYHLTEKLDALDSLVVHISEFEEEFMPYLEFQLSISPMYRFLDKDGVEWWMGPDGRPHGVLYDNGKAWCVYSNAKREL